MHSAQGALRWLCIAGSGVMTAPEILISLHSMDTGKDGVPLKRVMVCLDACMKEDQRQAFPPEAMAVALQQLVTRSAAAQCPCRECCE